jgi:5-methylcytosine-specific restriction endonuclease McrA
LSSIGRSNGFAKTSAASDFTEGPKRDCSPGLSRGQGLGGRRSEKAKAARKARYAAHREEEKARVRERYHADPEKAAARHRAYREDNPEKVKARHKARWEAGREKREAARKAYLEANRETILAAREARRAASRDRMKAQAKAWREAHPERMKALQRAWHKAHPEAGRAQKSKRRARIRAAQGSHTAAEKRALFDRQGARCVCGKRLTARNRHLDHVIALSRGGSNAIANLQWLCAPCNRSKGVKDPSEWAQEQGRLL